MKLLAVASLAALFSIATGAGAQTPDFLAGDADNAAAMARDPNARQPDGSTALQWAAYAGNAAEVRRLVAAGADVNARNDFGASALSVAAAAGDVDIPTASALGYES